MFFRCYHDDCFAIVDEPRRGFIFVDIMMSTEMFFRCYHDDCFAIVDEPRRGFIFVDIMMSTEF